MTGAPRNARYGAVTNPWDRSRWTGGSSTGSAGALAARLVPLALGTDTGGSIRVPSALCNLTGIKPTYGLVPRTGVASLSWTLDHIGPMARSAADLRVVLDVLAGPDDLDPAAAPDAVARPILQQMEVAVAMGPAPGRAIQQLAHALGQTALHLPLSTGAEHSMLAWFLAEGPCPVRLRAPPRRAERPAQTLDVDGVLRRLFGGLFGR